MLALLRQSDDPAQGTYGNHELQEIEQRSGGLLCRGAEYWCHPMKIPKGQLDRLLARCSSLIAEGEQILQSVENVPARYENNWITGEPRLAASAHQRIDTARFFEWRTKTATFLHTVIPKGHVHMHSKDEVAALQPVASTLQSVVSFLKGLRNDLEEGFFDEIAGRIEAELASDYMGQAETLLKEGQTGKFDHIPAAVLAGAVLEKALRALCSNRQPPVALIDAKGNPKTLNPLIDDLKKAGIFNETKAKQLRGWAAIRNHAAHGQFDQISRSDVEPMLHGVNNFLADFL